MEKQNYQNQAIYQTNYSNSQAIYGNYGKICPACGNYISEHATICPICGNGKIVPKNKYEQKLLNTTLPENKNQPRSRWMVLLLSWIGYGFGYLYLGYQNKFAERASRFLRAFIYLITIVAAPYGIILLLYAIWLHIYDMFYLTFIIKYDAYGNPIKWSKAKVKQV